MGEQEKLETHQLVGSAKRDDAYQKNKFLGIMCDSRLTFVSHLKYLKNKCFKAMNLLRVISHMDWGADTAEMNEMIVVRPKLTNIIYENY